MIDKNNGGPAFPGLHPSKECRYQDEGMTLRDYFAAKVIAPVLTGSKLPEESWPTMLPIVARFGYAMADAMLEERDKP